MRTLPLALITLLAAGAAGAGDVYVTKDANGNTVYTDTPQTIPAQKVGVASTPEDDAEAAARYQAEMAQLKAQDQAASQAQAQQAAAKKAGQLSAEDQAKRCTDARQRYQKLMESWRVYEQGPNGERIYLSSDQIDAARQSAKQVMDQFCSGQPAQ
jgi:cell pole-organizing protein PopZ